MTSIVIESFYREFARVTLWLETPAKRQQKPD